jgi:Gas vesicle synthesis protein GvpL/GvpF
VTLELLAITDGEPPSLPDGARCVRAGRLMAIVSDAVWGSPRGADDLWRRNAVVEDLMASVTVLPARLGTQAVDDEELRALLAAREQDLLASLELVEGCVELAVRVPVHAGAREGGGRGYLATRLVARARAREVIDQLEPLSVACQARTDGSEVRAAFLVPRGEVEVFQRAVSQLGDGVTCTGPWAPYSFAGPR